VPSLRNVALTSPYMHDGSITTLKEIISHYNSGGKRHPNKSAGIKKLKLTIEEQQAIEAFLHSLTDKKAIEQYTQLLR
jgi:cytochrome c peroxidase